MRRPGFVRAAAFAAALGAITATGVHAHSAAHVHAPLVSASSEEGVIPLTFVDPRYPSTLTDQADRLAADVNAERVRHGIAPLARDPALDRFANAKAIEMAARGYFGHTDPDGVTFADRIHAWHWPVPYVAENIAFDYDEPRANTAFLTSPPHEANVVDPHESRIGVAVVTVGNGQTFYVEDFSAK